eukprot:CAMPEP_0170555502 /NCGR_PEP_ID=MMETSP0211-20121228/13402_1 /TAXON_ID=311385 /ORGANISM="Pseudokeronopsis sp., Strain OXSARD2" /LENGTH=100 /DNA_ID=CAMNT_0010865391 /DNA_START=114 /DNA_END=413 /DNA_ORIENTATION=+
MDDIVLEYLDLVKKYPGESDLKIVRTHLHKFLHAGFSKHTDLRGKLATAPSIDIIREVALEMKARREGMKPSEKLGWYYRYWPSMKLSIESNLPYTLEDW